MEQASVDASQEFGTEDFQSINKKRQRGAAEIDWTST